MSAHQEALFETPAEERARAQRDEWELHRTYLESLTGCPFCGQPESSPWLYGNNHGYLMGWPQYHDGSGCSRLHLLGNQALAAAQRGDEATVFDRWVEITRYQEDATDWPAEWFAALEAELRAAGVIA